MNNVNVLDYNGQNISIDLVSYFKSDNKNYLFYTKNEIVQDGLIKMYVASEFNGVQVGIDDNEWANLKKIMQSIIMGGSNVTFLPFNNSIKLNESRAIALNDKNINLIKDVYKNEVNKSTSQGNLNKDLLAQSFGGNNIDVPKVEKPVQISSIPNVQNSFNMESTPVNLNMNPVNLDSNSNINNSINDNQLNNNQPNNILDTVPSIEPLPTQEISGTQISNEVPLNINSIKPGGIDSGFKVTNEPNIFDQPMDTNPFNITQEEINKPLDVVNSVDSTNVIKSDNNIDYSKQIALNERKIKLFNELAEIYKEENELLKGSGDSPLEKTASNLFNNDGTLNGIN